MTPEQAWAGIIARHPHLAGDDARLLYAWEPGGDVLMSTGNAGLEGRHRAWREGVRAAYAVVAVPSALAQTAVYFLSDRHGWQPNPYCERHLIRHLVDELAATRERLDLFLRHRPSGIMPLMRELDAATARAEKAEAAEAALEAVRQKLSTEADPVATVEIIGKLSEVIEQASHAETFRQKLLRSKAAYSALQAIQKLRTVDDAKEIAAEALAAIEAAEKEANNG